ncbi:hypothetical protein QBC42DRAFT_290437 [Cladorrhinum samala]|uniref:Uncharacterized protein n=1 Tax=Cladorrhinum samala TaxID=585594 RepID=A0AAV9HCK5_9PEZI|nr:hypothetical protein QBC42DRAFT_290437 [Cladorrhinum samala]
MDRLFGKLRSRPLRTSNLDSANPDEAKQTQNSHRSPSTPSASAQPQLESAKSDHVQTEVTLSLPQRSRSLSANRLGLSLVHAPPAPLADLIFVHGLGGTSHGTWSWQHNPHNFWPAWLAEDAELSRCRSFTYGYNADFKQDTSSAIIEFSRDLLLRLKTWTPPSRPPTTDRTTIGTYPIIFVMHSMGGLVVKKAYIIGSCSEQFQYVVSQVRAMLFLATPHRGSAFAELLNDVILSTFPSLSRKLYVAELASTAPSLQDINEQFRNVCEGLSLGSLYETQKTALGLSKKMIVDKESAVLGYPGEISAPLNADHHGVAKFKGVDDPNYIQVKDLVGMILRNLKPDDDIAMPMLVSQRTKLERVFGVYSDPSFDLEILEDRMMRGSCRWILHRETFRQWKHDLHDGCSLLWIRGLPGVGKSVLSSFVIRSLQKDFSDLACCYYFFNSRDQAKRSIKHMLTTVAFQMALQSKPFRQRLLDLHDAGKFSVDQLQAVNVWESVFQRMLFHQTAERTMLWVIDGLDEADHPELLIRLLSKLEPNCRLRLLIVSRPIKEATALRSLRIKWILDEITLDDTRDDIQSYAYEVVGSILSDDGLRDSICSKIVENAQGSFLWVDLALKELREHWHTPDTLSQALEELPESMGAFYDRMIQIIARQPAKLRAMASRILEWGMCSLRPLGLRELETALAIEFGAFLKLEDSVSQLCANFVIVRKSQVALIHDTARSFLLDRDGGRPLLISPQSGHQHISEACVKFLMAPKSDWRRVLTSSQTAAFDNHPFLSYAASCWAHHASYAPTSSDLGTLVEKFLNKSALLWIHAVALLGDMRILTRTGESLRALSDCQTDTTTKENLLQWSRDLTRFPGRFGRILALDPLAIYQHIVPFCPTQSMLRRHFGQFDAISVSGVSESSWGNCVGRLILGKLHGFIIGVVCQGPYVVAVTANCELIVAYAESCDEIKRITLEEVSEDEIRVPAMASSETPSLLAVADGRRVRIWDLATGEEVLSTPPSPRGAVLALAFKNNDEHLLIGYDDLSVHCFKLATEVEEWEHTLRPPEAMRIRPDIMSISPGGDWVIVVCKTHGHLYAWSLDMPDSRYPRQRLHPGCEWRRMPNRVLWRPEMLSVFIKYVDGALFEWDLQSDMLKKLPNISAEELALSFDGKLLCVDDEDRSAVLIWRLSDNSILHEWYNRPKIRAFAFSPDGRRLYRSFGPYCDVWELDAILDAPVADGCLPDSPAEPGAAIEDSPEPDCWLTNPGIRSVLLDASGCVYLTRGWYRQPLLYDPANRQTATGNQDTVSIIRLGNEPAVLSPSGRYVATGDPQRHIILYTVRRSDTPEGHSIEINPIHKLSLMENPVQLLFHRSDEYILIAWEDAESGPHFWGRPLRLGVWNLQTGKRVCTSTFTTWHRARFTQHPSDAALFICVDQSAIRTFRWDSLTEVGQEGGGTGQGQDHRSEYGRNPIEGDVAIWRTTFAFDFGDSTEATQPTLDHVVFLDHDYCFCTWDLRVGAASLKRHFYLPKDWLSSGTLDFCVVNDQGIIVCVREDGEVAVIRQGIKL